MQAEDCCIPDLLNKIGLSDRSRRQPLAVSLAVIYLIRVAFSSIGLLMVVLRVWYILLGTDEVDGVVCNKAFRVVSTSYGPSDTAPIALGLR